MTSLLSLLHDQGGFTLTPDLTPAALVAGYIVSDNRTIKVSDSLLSDALLAAILRELSSVAAHDALYVGAWRDNDTGIVHFDLSAVVPSMDQAVAIGRAYSQLAIWDIANNCEMRL